MPSIITNIDVEPLRGYALYHLQRDMTYNQTVSLMRRNPHLAGYSTAQIRTAASRGLKDYQAFERLEKAGPSGSLREAYLGKVFGGTKIGVRVIIDATLRNGQSRSFSVLVNASPYTSRETIVSAALDFANNHKSDWGDSGRFVRSVGAAAIIQIVSGGFSGGHVDCRQAGCAPIQR